MEQSHNLVLDFRVMASRPANYFTTYHINYLRLMSGVFVVAIVKHTRTLTYPRVAIVLRILSAYYNGNEKEIEDLSLLLNDVNR